MNHVNRQINEEEHKFMVQLEIDRSITTLVKGPLKATVENPTGTVKKLSYKDSIEGAHTVLRGSVRAPKGFFKGLPKATKPRGSSPCGFAAKGSP